MADSYENRPIVLLTGDLLRELDETIAAIAQLPETHDEFAWRRASDNTRLTLLSGLGAITRSDLALTIDRAARFATRPRPNAARQQVYVPDRLLDILWERPEVWILRIPRLIGVERE